MFGKKYTFGYTLIEMIVVVGIICVLTALAMPEMNGVVEKNNLKQAEEIVRQAVIEARTMSIAPKGGATGTSVVAGFEASMYTNISGKTVARDASNNQVTVYPVMIRGIVTSCDDENKVLYRQEKKNFVLPENIVIESFDPDKNDYQDTYNSGAIKMSSVRFKLTDFSVKCGGSAKAADANDANFWTSGSEVFQIRLHNKRVKSGQQEYGYVNVNKYSGQVWAAQSLQDQAKVTVPKDNEDATYAEAWSVTSGAGLQEEYLHVSSFGFGDYKGYLFFRLQDLNSRGNFPKKARIWLTAAKSTRGKVKVSLEEPPTGLYDPNNVGSIDGKISTLIGNDTSTKYFIKTLTFDGDSENYQQSFDINLAKYKDFWKNGSDYDFSKPLVLYLEADTNDTDLEFNTQKAYKKFGKACLDPYGPMGPSGDICKMSVRPAPFVEFIY